MEARPEAVWQVVEEYGDSEDEDMRTAVATLLLETLLLLDFETYFSRTRALIRGGRRGFIDTLDLCGFMFRNEKLTRIERAVRNARRGVGDE